MTVLHIILLALAVVCFGLSAWPPAAERWNRLISVGLCAWALSALITFAQLVAK